MTHIKHANTDYEIMEELSKRWSPYGYSDQPVEPEKIRAMFEAARWAASSFNEQPWRYIIGTKDQPELFEKILACLVDGNQAWAKHAYLIGLGVIRTKFSKNDKNNRVALHDLGLASGNICAQATHLGLQVHQMGGILPDKARELFEIPEPFEPVTGIAIGHADEPDDISDEFKKRDTTPRTRRSLDQFVFGGNWEEVSELVKK